MKKVYARNIENRKDAEFFCKNILFYNIPNDKLLREKQKEYNNAVNEIIKQEKLLKSLSEEQSNTLDSKDNRMELYRTDENRELLRIKIAEQCLTEKRLSENKTTYKKGGMLPHSKLNKDSQFYLVIGLPASGKSSISEKLAEETGSVYLDADIVKRKIPEFSQDTRGASLVHLESVYILRPSSDMRECTDYNIMLNCFQNKCNIVYNMIGDDYKWLYSLIKMVQSKDYYVHLLLVELDRFKCVQRAYERYKKTKRYISLPLIFDVYANNPTISFFQCILNKVVESFAYINNDVDIGKPKNILINSFKNKDVINSIANLEVKNEKK